MCVMPRLEDALSASGYLAAYFDTQARDRIIVEQTSAGPKPEDGFTYTVKAEHGLAMPGGSFTSPDLGAVLKYLRSLGVRGFDPASDGWQPASRETYTRSAEWSVDAPERGLPPEDSALGAHAGETLPE